MYIAGYKFIAVICKEAYECYSCFSWCKLGLIRHNQHSPQDKVRTLLKLSVFFVGKTQPYLCLLALKGSEKVQKAGTSKQDGS